MRQGGCGEDVGGGLHAAVDVNKAADTGVGALGHRHSVFHGTKAGDVGVLKGHSRPAEPAVIGDMHHETAAPIGKGAYEVRIDHFITDGGKKRFAP